MISSQISCGLLPVNAPMSTAFALFASGSSPHWGLLPVISCHAKWHNERRTGLDDESRAAADGSTASCGG